MQTFPLQHPFGHDAASHTHLPVEPLQACPLAHALHATPLLPQALVASVVMQLPLASQHPFGQLVASHTHLP
jgi:hypothetical protein